MNGLLRDVDVYLLGAVAGGSLALSVYDGGALAAYGPAEAVQKFVVALLTRRGSVVTAPEAGTYFLQQLTSGQLRTESDVSSAMAVAAHDTVSYLAGLSEEDDDTDEDIVSARVLSASVSPGVVSVSLSLVTRAGSNVAVTLPFALSR